MKLKTKFQDEDFELGEVVDASIMYGYDDKIEVYCLKKMKHRKYKSIKDFTDHWEDAPEAKGCWIINILGIVEYTHFRNKDEAEMLTEIGNRFETEEEAKQAVEKLKAFTRLEDKGFKFDGIDFSHRTIKFKVPSSFFDGEENIFVSEQSNTDLKFLFSQEND